MSQGAQLQGVVERGPGGGDRGGGEGNEEDGGQPRGVNCQKIIVVYKIDCSLFFVFSNLIYNINTKENIHVHLFNLDCCLLLCLLKITY